MKRFIKEIYPYIIIVIVVLLFKKFVATPVRVVGPSMNDTLLDKDIMILNKLTYRFRNIKRFDIVVIDYDNDLIIKRVIGLPGDNIKYSDNKLFINGKEYEEKYLSLGTETNTFDLKELTGFDKIPDNYYFVLGDNRKNSKDSRVIGLVNKKDIEGNAKIIVFPFKRIGKR